MIHSSMADSLCQPAARSSIEPEKLCVDSLGSLVTMENDRVRDSDSEGSGHETDEDFHSDKPEAAETLPDHDLASFQGGDDADKEAMLAIFGIADYDEGEPLVWSSSITQKRQRGVEVPRLRNLFWRQYLARREPSGQLTAARLEAHATAQRGKAKPDARASSAGTWLQTFKATAQMVPVADAASRALGQDLGPGVAAFVGGEAVCSSSQNVGSDLDKEIQNGHRVEGPKAMTFYGCVPHGRCGFLIEDNVSVSTPACSSSNDRPSFATSDSAEERPSFASVAPSERPSFAIAEGAEDLQLYREFLANQPQTTSIGTR